MLLDFIECSFRYLSDFWHWFQVKVKLENDSKGTDSSKEAKVKAKKEKEIAKSRAEHLTELSLISSQDPPDTDQVI